MQPPLAPPLHTLIKNREGLRLRPYADRNGWAVGYGHRITPLEWMRRIASGQEATISRREAECFFLADLARARLWARRIFPDHPPPGPRRDALIAMIYQLGPGGAMAFRRMRAAIAHNDWEEAARQALDSRWAAQTPARAREIAGILRSGAYSNSPGRSV